MSSEESDTAKDKKQQSTIGAVHVYAVCKKNAAFKKMLHTAKWFDNIVIHIQPNVDHILCSL